MFQALKEDYPFAILSRILDLFALQLITTTWTGQNPKEKNHKTKQKNPNNLTTEADICREVL